MCAGCAQVDVWRCGSGFAFGWETAEWSGAGRTIFTAGAAGIMYNDH